MEVPLKRGSCTFNQFLLSFVLINTVVAYCICTLSSGSRVAASDEEYVFTDFWPHLNGSVFSGFFVSGGAKVLNIKTNDAKLSL